ncbi:polysaccharide deacetylase family protein [Acinetobacter sp. YH12116]|uniref:polysaccharide deacetylase family protein n=1 Tax=Acinetobacter sp. YH12116 TaxID=2601103 RepID=UPI0015D247A5|nr:polysaccharide deacetylase family protein [Acinetobacter sp. YH12116]
MFFSQNQLKWLEQIFFERFGIKFNFELTQETIVLKKEGSDKKLIFTNLDSAFYQFGKTQLGCYEWNAETEGLVGAIDPVLKAPSTKPLSTPIFSPVEQDIYVNYDVLGLVYWCLNRLEEVGRTDLDNHQRFPAIHSHAYHYNYLERPIVDEWLNILGQIIQQVWLEVELKQHTFNMKVSHDVDSPSPYAFKSWGEVLRIMIGHLVKRHDMKAFIETFWIKFATKEQLHEYDPHNTFDWLMQQSNANNLTSAFYFICGGTTDKDAEYTLAHPVIQKLMQHIHQNGHEIGLHPSYATYQAPELIQQEADNLRYACEQAGIDQTTFGGRMHYLRWEHPTTLQAWENAGMSYDSTLSYADRPGFRCGTCFEYPAFNPMTQQSLNIRIRPLIAMECTIIDPIYLGLNVTPQAENKFLELKDKCRRVSGCFTTLWHNSYFKKNEMLKGMYQRIIES